LAQWFHRAGAHVAGVAGRDRGRTDAVVGGISKQLGDEVVAYDHVSELAEAVDALVVACPVEGHLDGLDAALRAGVPCLCEKPLVAASDYSAAIGRVRAFRQSGLMLVENCQWPYTLSALRELYPDEQRPVRRLAMRLSPASPGRVMVEDSLSHVLSMVQALVALPADAQVRSVSQSDAATDAERNVVRFAIAGGIDAVEVELQLECCPEQPRPAWYAVNGRRLERRIGPDYAISFASDDGRIANVQDPLGLLVYGFVANLQRNQLERSDDLDAIELRLRLYTGVLESL